MLCPFVRRLQAFILVAAAVLFGTGLLGYVHALQHGREDAAEALAARTAGQPVDAHHEHDDNNCPTHAQLHMLLIVTGWALAFVCVGRPPVDAFVKVAIFISTRARARLSCRDPPLISI